MFRPTYFTEKVTDITIKFLQYIKVKGVILDIDNTLVSYEVSNAPSDITNWINTLKNNGIKVIILSNNTESRVKNFVSTLKIPYISMALKPMTKNLKKAIKTISCNPKEVIMIGDQIFTDVLMSNLMGIRSILVNPIDEAKGFIIRLRRTLEKPIRKQCYLNSKINLSKVIKNIDIDNFGEDNNS